MKKNQPTTTKSTAIILDTSKSLMGITKKILESKNKVLVKTTTSQNLTTHKDITIIGDLMWEKETQKNMDWDEAMEYAKNLRLGGYDDWRLPTAEELSEVVALCGGIGGIGGGITFSGDWGEVFNENQAIENYQPNYKAKGFTFDPYWSSTTNANSDSAAWLVYFYSGKRSLYSKPDRYYVRCVRAGQ